MRSSFGMAGALPRLLLEPEEDPAARRLPALFGCRLLCAWSGTATRSHTLFCLAVYGAKTCLLLLPWKERERERMFTTGGLWKDGRVTDALRKEGRCVTDGAWKEGKYTRWI